LIAAAAFRTFGSMFERGERVFLSSGGVGIIVAFAARDAHGKPSPWRPEMGPPGFYVVDTEELTACIPTASAHETLRRLVTADEALRMLEMLRASDVPPPETPEPLLERGKRVVHSGSPLEHARLLRELYGLPVPLSDAIAAGLALVGRLVLAEIAAVLGMDRHALEAEMRGRYRAAEELQAASGIRFTGRR
jgi:RNA polymerase-interacting CarD/CdnL/TRCF family regulator